MLTIFASKETPISNRLTKQISNKKETIFSLLNDRITIYKISYYNEYKNFLEDQAYQEQEKHLSNDQHTHHQRLKLQH